MIIPGIIAGGRQGFPAPIADPNFANVSLLIRGNDGADGSSVFVDESSIGHALTTVGTAQVRRNVYKFGGGSCQIPVNSSITAAHATSLDITTGDFTIDLWFRRAASSVLNEVYCTKSNGTIGLYPFQLWYEHSSTKVGFRGCDSGSLVYALQSTSTVSPTVWNYMRCVRNGNTFELSLNGAMEASSSFSGTLYSASDAVAVGGYNSGVGSMQNGHLDDVRITKGVARATTFTNPGEAAPY